MTVLRLGQLCEHGIFYMLVPLRNFQLGKFETLPQTPKDEIIYFLLNIELQTWSVQLRGSSGECYVQLNTPRPSVIGREITGLRGTEVTMN